MLEFNQYAKGEEEIAPGVFRKITHLDTLMMTLMRFENGPASAPDPYHSHPHEQLTYVVKGELKFIIEGEEALLKTGDTIRIESGKQHTIQCLTASVHLVDAFSPIREDFLV